MEIYELAGKTVLAVETPEDDKVFITFTDYTRAVFTAECDAGFDACTPFLDIEVYNVGGSNA